MIPRANARLYSGKISVAMDMLMGTNAPPPAAWTTRAAMSMFRFRLITHSALPTTKTASATVSIMRLPRTSATLPNSGMATV
ncbi:MAG: hypothetical protein BWY79_01869 [Actinobacteria bacterium ADurb.Bin444]|nr:MAG: hypothetical protein BWY79_01869 [Actinobacteria bacterium ADurb.Bin444]